MMQWKKFLYSMSVLSRAIEMSTGSGFPPPSDPPPPCLAKKCEREHVRERQSKEGRRLGTELWCLRGGKKKKSWKNKTKEATDLMSTAQKDLARGTVWWSRAGKCEPDVAGKFPQRICEAEEEGRTDIKDRQFAHSPLCLLTRLTQQPKVSSARCHKLLLTAGNTLA